MLQGKWVVLSILLLVASLAWGGGKTYDIVFDLDWTLIDGCETGNCGSSTRILQAAGKDYWLVNWTEEVLTRLSKTPGVRISFFSGGDVVRNEQVLRQIKLTDGSGRSALDVAYRVLSRPDLTQVPTPKGVDPAQVRFWERSRKDLTKVTPDLSGAVLVDDVQKFIVDSQTDHELWLGRTYIPYESYGEAQKALREAQKAGHDTKYIPDSYDVWSRNQNKLVRVYAILKDALGGPEDAPLAARIQAVQKNHSDGELMLSGMAELKGSLSISDCLKLQLQL